MPALPKLILLHHPPHPCLRCNALAFLWVHKGRCCPGLCLPAFQRDSLASFETSTVRCRACSARHLVKEKPHCGRSQCGLLGMALRNQHRMVACELEGLSLILSPLASSFCAFRYILPMEQEKRAGGRPRVREWADYSQCVASNGRNAAQIASRGEIEGMGLQIERGGLEVRA